MQCSLHEPVGSPAPRRRGGSSAAYHDHVQTARLSATSLARRGRHLICLAPRNTLAVSPAMYSIAFRDCCNRVFSHMQQSTSVCSPERCAGAAVLPSLSFRRVHSPTPMSHAWETSVQLPLDTTVFFSGSHTPTRCPGAHAVPQSLPTLFRFHCWNTL
ncbi:hypothetical protein BC628DRAFT_697089 [Trametes gibbosa]|nr:hypothetical protein BC628DRAFT_697089 [Trametes gibbosa]